MVIVVVSLLSCYSAGLEYYFFGFVDCGSPSDGMGWDMLVFGLVGFCTARC